MRGSIMARKTLSEVAWNLLGDPAGKGSGWVGYDQDHKVMLKGLRHGIAMGREQEQAHQKETAAQAKTSPS